MDSFNCLNTVIFPDQKIADNWRCPQATHHDIYPIPCQGCKNTCCYSVIFGNSISNCCDHSNILDNLYTPDSRKLYRTYYRVGSFQVFLRN